MIKIEIKNRFTGSVIFELDVEDNSIAVTLQAAVSVNADLTCANLRDANLSGADLSGANLCGANLCGADLSSAKNIPFTPTYLPEGEFIGWKKLPNGIMVKLKILEDTGLLVNAGVTINCLGEDYVDDEADGTVVFLGVEHQRGTFFVADLELEDSFDPARLRFDYHNANGWSVSQTLWYDGEAYEIDGPDTVNTSAQFSLTLVGEEAILAAEQAALAAQVAPVVEEEEEEPEGEDEVAQAAQRFFAMYAFVTQYCDEEADRPIHLYMDDEDDGGEVSRSLAEQLAPLFPNDRLLAVCEEDPQSLHGANGELSGWNGLATVVTNSGLYHIKSNSSGAYELDGKTAYLSWAKLFGDCKANLMIRSEVPDIWIGTADAYLVKASYVDFSSSVSIWIYFDDLAGGIRGLS